MSLSINEIVTLSRAGFSAQTIQVLNALGGQVNTNSAAQTGAAVDKLQTDQSNQLPPGGPSAQIPLAQQNAQSVAQSDQNAYIKALQDLNLRLATGQAPTQEQTTESILAGIINPPMEDK